MIPGTDPVVPVRWQALVAIAVLMLLVNFISGAWSPASAFAAPTAGPEADKTEEPAPAVKAEPTKAKSKKGTTKKKHHTPKLSPGQRVNLNTASRAELEKLPGIGPKKAQAIIKGRPYKNPKDIMKIKGIKKGTFNKLKEFITVK